MWLTGFDAPSCSTIYLDKPMRNHTLMQTIARANRVFPGKHSGTIVDYANVFASLESALAIYGKGSGGETPVRDKKALVEDLRKEVAGATAYCKAHDVDLARIEATPTVNFGRAQAVEDAANRLLAPEAVKRGFLSRARDSLTRSTARSSRIQSRSNLQCAAARSGRSGTTSTIALTRPISPT